MVIGLICEKTAKKIFVITAKSSGKIFDVTKNEGVEPKMWEAKEQGGDGTVLYSNQKFFHLCVDIKKGETA